MAYSQQDIYGKVGDLLLEINEQYAALNKDSLGANKTDVLLLAAQAKYLAAHLDVLASLQPAEAAPVEKAAALAVAQEEIFTPAVDIKAQEADSQPVVEEIQEVPADGQTEETEVAAPEQAEEAVPEQHSNEIKFEGFGQADDSVTTNEPDQEEAATVENLEEEVEEEEEPVEEIQEVTPVREEYKHTAASAYTSVETETAKEEPVAEKPVETPATPTQNEPVVNEVVIEEKQVSIPEERQEPSLNDLAKQAEDRPARPLTLNELIQQQKKAGLTNVNQFQTSGKPSEAVVDLKTAVSLNDKLLFIKDLFNGYSLAYSEAIELLNRFDNFAEADAFLQSNYALKNNWATKPQTVDKLYAVLRKKYN